jgi:primary-amine oxidase
MIGNRIHSIVLVLALLSQPDAIFAAKHPLDPLSDREIRVAVDTLWKAGRVDKSSRFAIVKLAEPDKQAMLTWRPGDDIPRRAFAAVRHERALYETVVDVRDRKVLSWRAIDCAQPAQLADEWMLAQQIVRNDATWRAAAARRGVDDPKSLVCVPALPGYFGPDEDPARRLGRITCYDASGDRNLWGRPLEGLVATIDFDERRVIDLLDTPPVAARRWPTRPARRYRTSRRGAETTGSTAISFGGAFGSFGCMSIRAPARFCRRSRSAMRARAIGVRCCIGASWWNYSCPIWIPTAVGTFARSSTWASTASAPAAHRCRPVATARETRR